MKLGHKNMIFLIHQNLTKKCEKQTLRIPNPLSRDVHDRVPMLFRPYFAYFLPEFNDSLGSNG